MIKSEIFKGLIYAGVTQLASTIEVAQTGSLQITVQPGRFTTTAGVTVALSEATVINFQAEFDQGKDYWIELGLLNSQPELLVVEQIHSYDDVSSPAGWQIVQILVLPFQLLPGQTQLPDIYVFKVLPGFPAGTGPEDWQVQVEGQL